MFGNASLQKQDDVVQNCYSTRAIGGLIILLPWLQLTIQIWPKRFRTKQIESMNLRSEYSLGWIKDPRTPSCNGYKKIGQKNSELYMNQANSRTICLHMIAVHWPRMGIEGMDLRQLVLNASCRRSSKRLPTHEVSADGKEKHAACMKHWNLKIFISYYLSPYLILC
jgi:hypothetical protein